MGRVFLSAIVLIITHLIVGSISLSLGLLVAIVLAGAFAVTIILFAVLGACHTFEKLGWVSPGWTDSKIVSLKNWAKLKWTNLPGWYKTEKKRIIEMLIETLKGRERAAEEVQIWKSAAVGLAVLFAVLLVKHSLRLSIGWSIGVVAVGSVLVAFPVLYVMARRSDRQALQIGDNVKVSPRTHPQYQEDSDKETKEALKYLVELHRSGKLKSLLEEPRSVASGAGNEEANPAHPASAQEEPTT